LVNALIEKELMAMVRSNKNAGGRKENSDILSEQRLDNAGVSNREAPGVVVGPVVGPNRGNAGSFSKSWHLDFFPSPISSPPSPLNTSRPGWAGIPVFYITFYLNTSSPPSFSTSYFSVTTDDFDQDVCRHASRYPAVSGTDSQIIPAAIDSRWVIFDLFSSSLSPVA
jgi:hypothetical protein